MNLVRTARTDDRSATDYPSADPQAPRSFNQEPRVLKSISSPCLSVRGHVRTSHRYRARASGDDVAHMNRYVLVRTGWESTSRCSTAVEAMLASSRSISMPV